MKQIFCPKCGSDEITSDAVARWDEEKQAWVLTETFDDKFCSNCDYEAPEAEFTHHP